MEGWVGVKKAARYADVGERTLRGWLKHGLRYVQVSKKILIKIEWIDQFLGNHEATQDKVDQLADEAFKKAGG
jgi:hypothetical protein